MVANSPHGVGRGAYGNTFVSAAVSAPLAPALRRQIHRIEDTPKKRYREKGPPAQNLPAELRQRYLNDFVKQAVGSLSKAALSAIRENFRERAGPVVLTLGTACSGSEFYLTALPWLAQELELVLGRSFRFKHLWSCEIVAEKQQWIFDNFRPPKIFADITALAGGTALDVLTGSWVTVDPVDVLIAGTSCKDASALNIHRTERRNSIDDRSHTTGSTFDGLARLVYRFGRRCSLVLLENVPDLARVDKKTRRSNLDGVRDELTASGFSFACRTFSARDTGLPVARARLYMAGCRTSTPEQIEERIESELDRILAAAKPRSLDSMLVPETEATQMLYDWWPEAYGRPMQLSLWSSGARWEKKHGEVWSEEIPEHVADEVASSVAANPWFAVLSPRQRDLLLIDLARARVLGRPLASVGLQMSLGWGGRRSEEQEVSVPTLVPKSLFWLVQRQRLLLGIEAVRLQGVDLCDLPALEPGKYTASFLHDLAGNAFCVYQFASWFLACLTAAQFPSQA